MDEGWWLFDKSGSYIWIYGVPDTKHYRCMVYIYAGQWVVQGPMFEQLGPFNTLEEAKAVALIRF